MIRVGKLVEESLNLVRRKLEIQNIRVPQPDHTFPPLAPATDSGKPKGVTRRVHTGNWTFILDGKLWPEDLEKASRASSQVVSAT